MVHDGSGVVEDREIAVDVTDRNRARADCCDLVRISLNYSCKGDFPVSRDTNKTTQVMLTDRTV